MKTLEANLIDVIQKRIFPARISFDTHIRNIEPIDVAPDLYILPGLVDAHVHIESSMLPPSEFARLAVRHGTLAAVSDPHEIANVLGVAGIDFMVQDAARVPFRFVFGAPSCVPATPFETSGATITADDIDQLFVSQKVSFLSEMMNFPGVVQHIPAVMAKIAIAHHYGKPVDGHAPGLTGDALQTYIRAGISTDHECNTLAEAEEKIRLGMKILIRNGSAAKNFEVLFPLIDRYPDQVMLCTDDLHPDDLLRGHINQLLARGVARGVDLFSLLRAATVNPVHHYQIDLGLVQHDDPADFVVVDNLRDFTVRKSYLGGKCVYDRVGEEHVFDRKATPIQKYPNCFGVTKISITDIELVATSGKMKVIEASDGDLFTRKVILNVQKNSTVEANTGTDTLKLVVLNRYQPAKPSVAFIRGFGLKYGALASTVSHDSHNIIAVGCDDDSIIKAINHIIDLKGGLTAICHGQSIDLKLDIAGLMSSASGEDVSLSYEALNQAAARMGTTLTAPFMTLSFMALLVIPELKLGDKGLFDVTQFDWTDIFIPEC